MQDFIRDRKSYLVLPTSYISELPPTDTTPTVANCLVYKCIATAPITVTNFTEGAEGQSIRIKGDGFTTIKNNTTIKTNTGADKLLAATKVYTLTLIDGVWYEAE